MTNFAELRYDKGFDSFFTFSGSSNEAQKLKNAQVNEAVRMWHNQLRMETKRRDPDEGLIFERMIKLLSNDVLVIDPKQRQKTTIWHIREQLIEAYKSFAQIALIGPVVPKIPESEGDSPSEDWKKGSSGSSKRVMDFFRRMSKQRAGR